MQTCALRWWWRSLIRSIARGTLGVLRAPIRETPAPCLQLIMGEKTIVTLNVGFCNALYRPQISSPLRHQRGESQKTRCKSIYPECFCSSVASHLDSAGAFLRRKPCHANPDQVVPQAPRRPSLQYIWKNILLLWSLSHYFRCVAAAPFVDQFVLITWTIKTPSAASSCRATGKVSSFLSLFISRVATKLAWCLWNHIDIDSCVGWGNETGTGEPMWWDRERETAACNLMSTAQSAPIWREWSVVRSNLISLY